MTPTVFILAAVRNPALLEAALLVFKTVRFGFPTANIIVHGNQLETFAAQEVARAAQKVGAQFTNGAHVSHDQWIEELLHGQAAPFWICDTDVVFFETVEGWLDVRGVYGGRLEPAFHEEWTNSWHVERLHASLMWFNTSRVRQAMRTWMAGIPGLWHTAQMNLIRQQFIPRTGRPPLFYDSTAGLWHAVGGVAYSESQNLAFEHLHCATYSDLITAPGLKDLADVHKAVFANPSLARGMQRDQCKYYLSRQPEPGAELVIPEKGPAHAIQPRNSKQRRRSNR